MESNDTVSLKAESLSGLSVRGSRELLTPLLLLLSAYPTMPVPPTPGDGSTEDREDIVEVALVEVMEFDRL